MKGKVVGRQVGWRAGWLEGRLVGGQVGWRAGWLVGQLVGWHGWLVEQVGSRAGWLEGIGLRLVGGRLLICRLVGAVG